MLRVVRIHEDRHEGRRAHPESVRRFEHRRPRVRLAELSRARLLDPRRLRRPHPGLPAALRHLVSLRRWSRRTSADPHTHSDADANSDTNAHADADPHTHAGPTASAPTAANAPAALRLTGDRGAYVRSRAVENTTFP